MMLNYAVVLRSEDQWKPVFTLLREAGFTRPVQEEEDARFFSYTFEQEKREEFCLLALRLMQEGRIVRLIDKDVNRTSTMVLFCDVCGTSSILLPGKSANISISFHCDQLMRMFQSLTVDELAHIYDQGEEVLFYSTGQGMQWILDRGWHKMRINDVGSDYIELTDGTISVMVQIGFFARTTLRRME